MPRGTADVLEALCAIDPRLTEGMERRESEGMFIHYVNFWLKKSAPASAREQLVADCRKYLGGVPTVREMWAGPPAMTPREVVDNSYDVGLCVVLEDSAGHDAY